MAPRELDGRRELRLVVHLRDSDRRAEPRGLHEHRVAERVGELVAEAQRDVAGDRDAAVTHHLLEEVLVHAERRGSDAGADVGHVREVEQALHCSVLAERPVEERQDDVDLAERRRHTARRDRERLGGTPSRDWAADSARGPDPSSRGPAPSSQRPSRPIATVTASYRSGSSAASTERADASEISCSLDLPPARTATRMRRLTAAVRQAWS